MRLPDLYFGIDTESFFDLQLHIGRCRLELGGTTPQDRGSSPNPRDGQQDGKGSQCFRTTENS